MSRPTILRGGATALVRTIAGDVAADNATLSDANYPMTAAAGVIDCAGLDSIILGVEFTGTPGTATVIYELLFGDPDAPADRKWSRYFLGAAAGVTPTALAKEVTPAILANAEWAELRCFGHKYVFPRITTVANAAATGGTRVLVRPGRIRGDRGFTA